MFLWFFFYKDEKNDYVTMRKQLRYATKQFQTMGQGCDNRWVWTQGGHLGWITLEWVGDGGLHVDGALTHG
jgi:hypothetical protein